MNAANYASLVVLALSQNDSASAIGYLNEGLFIDPTNEGLNALLTAMDVGEESP